MEFTTLFGIIAGFAAIVISILIDKGDLGSFANLPSVFITIGGSVFATIASYPLKVIKTFGAVMKKAFQKSNIDLQKDIEMIINIANVARREGLLALEDAVTDIDSPFFKKGVMLVVDGADPELIKNIMQAEIYFVQDRHATGQSILDTMGALAPAYGMIGTLIGLINMLRNLDDPDSLGPGMAVALITTMYGSVLANLVFIPLSKKLKLKTSEETMEMELLLEGLLSIQDGENPRIIKDKLHSFIARSEIRDETTQPAFNKETEESRE